MARPLDSKQEALIGLNRDNERLTGELTFTRKQTLYGERQVATLAQ